jgi:hypothetical protein
MKSGFQGTKPEVYSTEERHDRRSITADVVLSSCYTIIRHKPRESDTLSRPLFFGPLGEFLASNTLLCMPALILSCWVLVYADIIFLDNKFPSVPYFLIYIILYFICKVKYFILRLFMPLLFCLWPAFNISTSKKFAWIQKAEFYNIFPEILILFKMPKDTFYFTCTFTTSTCFSGVLSCNSTSICHSYGPSAQKVIYISPWSCAEEWSSRFKNSSCWK